MKWKPLSLRMFYLRYLSKYRRLDEWIGRINGSVGLIAWLFVGLLMWSHRSPFGYYAGIAFMIDKIIGILALPLFFLYILAIGAKYLTLCFGSQTSSEPSAFSHLPGPSEVMDSRGRSYAMRLVRPSNSSAAQPDSDDITIFVEMALQEPGIAEAHTDLSRDQRRELYQKWWQQNSDSFLILEFGAIGAKADVVAVSIVLPLTEQGAAALRSRHSSALELEQRDIAERRQNRPRHPRHLLVDTWIVKESYKESRTRFKTALVLKHLSLFWRIRDRDMRLFAEPDTLKMKKHLGDWGFKRVERRNGVALFVVDFGDDSVEPSRAALLGRVANSIQTVRSWPLKVG